MSRICVYGHYHLGPVTIACLAQAGFEVVGLEDDAALAEALAKAQPPLFEPGLAEALQTHRVPFTTDKAQALAGAAIVWVTFDTPVDEDDVADTGYVMQRVESLFPHLRDGTVVLVSSQLPVGSVAALEKRFAAHAGGRQVAFACSPENLRLGQAMQAFTSQARIVAGCRDARTQAVLEPLLKRFCANVVWMSVESAEMSKHALNCHLAMQVAWTNEIARLCEQTGADAAEVEQALRAEPRIGPKAYVRAGAAFAGGTLARDVRFLQAMQPQPLIGSILDSNHRHGDWPLEALKRLGITPHATIAVLGLAYTPNSSSLRRSLAVRWCEALAATGASLHVFDPQVTQWPEAPAGTTLCTSAKEALQGAACAIIATEWPQFRALSAADFQHAMAAPAIIDPSRFLAPQLANQPGIRYVSVGRPS
jgi:UDPglucose 6-dehydrogenase